MDKKKSFYLLKIIPTPIMRKLALVLILFCSFYACSEKEENLVINGHIQGLKKGTLYLQKIQDSTLITIDSLEINGNSAFTFETNIESPQVLYLYLNKVDGTNYNDRLLFFAEPGEMTLNTTLKNFETEVNIEGSENQKKLEEFNKMAQRFNDQNLELIKKNLEAQKSGNDSIAMATATQYDMMLRRRYLFTVNYALNNNDMEVAPYLAISEVYDANIKYLDTIYNSLTPQVKDSKYGKSLKEFLKERRQQEKEQTTLDSLAKPGQVEEVAVQ